MAAESAHRIILAEAEDLTTRQLLPKQGSIVKYGHISYSSAPLLALHSNTHQTQILELGKNPDSVFVCKTQAVHAHSPVACGAVDASRGVGGGHGN